jgi:TldD protein
MLNQTDAQKVLDLALSLGADFSDIFVEKNSVNNIEFTDNRVKNIQRGTDFGIGIRVIFGTKALYGHTNLTEIEELLRITSLLCQMDKKDPAQDISLSFSRPITSNIHTITHGLDNDVPLEQKVAYLENLNKLTRAHESIAQVQLNAMQRMQQVEIFNTEGLHVQDQRHYARLAATAIAQDGSNQATGGDSPGAMAGWDFIENLNVEQLAQHAAKQALTMLHADDSPAGKLPVVIDSGFGGVIFHEACGHSLETTSVQKKASVFHDKMGEMIASEVVSATDDGTMPNEWGSINFDDEGTKTQRTELIKNGRLNSFLVDRVGELRTGYKRTGSGRKQSYKFAPASRMRNTFIEPGDSTLEEMIASIPNGIYAKQMGGGSVNPGTGEFNFSVREGYLIKDGKITRPVKGATLIGSGAEVLKNISMVGDNFAQAAGMCGSVSGAVPTNVGQAALKVDEILVGGRA